MIAHVRGTISNGLRDFAFVLYQVLFAMLLLQAGLIPPPIQALWVSLASHLFLVGAWVVFLSIGMGRSVTVGPPGLERSHDALPLSERTRAIAETFAVWFFPAVAAVGIAAIGDLLFGPTPEYETRDFSYVAMTAIESVAFVPPILSARLAAGNRNFAKGVTILPLFVALFWCGVEHSLVYPLGGGPMALVTAAMIVFATVLVVGPHLPRPRAIRDLRSRLPVLRRDRARVRPGLFGPEALQADLRRGVYVTSAWGLGWVTVLALAGAGVSWIAPGERSAEISVWVFWPWLIVALILRAPLGMDGTTSSGGKMPSRSDGSFGSAFGRLPVPRHQFARALAAYAAACSLMATAVPTILIAAGWWFDIPAWGDSGQVTLYLFLPLAPLLCAKTITGAIGTARERGAVNVALALSGGGVLLAFVLAETGESGGLPGFAPIALVFAISLAFGMGEIFKYLRAPEA